MNSGTSIKSGSFTRDHGQSFPLICFLFASLYEDAIDIALYNTVSRQCSSLQLICPENMYKAATGGLNIG